MEVKPIIFWEGFPACGLLLSRLVKSYPDLIIMATRPKVPFDDLEALLGAEIIWLDHADDILLFKDNYLDRNLIIFTGWWNSGWIKYSKILKKINNAKVVVVVDNSFKKTLRQLFGAIYFRLFLRRYFDAAFVPGHEGVKLMNFLGMPKDRIFRGNYGAYEKIYFDRVPISDRKAQFLFVGQLIHRKSVDIMIEGFKKYREDGGTWSLRILGDGPLRDICTGPGIDLAEFVQPKTVCNEMNNSRVLILASREEHWGTVVCEAAACGLALITSRYVGSSVDLVRHNVNGIEIKNLNSIDFKNAFHYFEKLSSEELSNMSYVSKGISRAFDSFSYEMSFRNLTQLVECDCNCNQYERND